MSAPKGFYWAVPVIIAVGVVGGALLPRLTAKTHSTGLLETPTALPDFALTDDRGKTTGLEDLKGRPWIGAFVFTSCGTQCPMMTAKMQRLEKKLPGVRLLSFSVDPADTPEKLAAYKKTYGIKWTFLTGGPGEVRGLCRDGFRLPVADGTSPEEPILHSKNLVLVDSEGQIRGYFDSDDRRSIKTLIQSAKAL